ncbi:MAG: DNA translocase FtsK [Clostridiales bacterium]|nr:DNA translocase FtsK [Clostridiales bacterium]
MAQTKKTPPKSKPNNNTKRPSPSAQKPRTSGGTRKAPELSESALAAKRQKWAVILLAGAVLFFCIALIRGQSLWYHLHCALFGFLGVCAWAIPFVLLATSILFAINKPIGSMKSSFIYAAVFIVILCGIIQVGSHDADYIEKSGYDIQFSDAWNYDSVIKSGGVIGVLVGTTLGRAFGKTPAMITMILALVVSFMLFSGTTLAALYKALSRPVKKVGDMADARIEQSIRRREENERLRDEKRERKKKFDPNIAIGPDPSPQIDYNVNDNFLPDYILPDNKNSGATKMNPPVLISSPEVDTEKAAAEDKKEPAKKGKKQETAKSDAAKKQAENEKKADIESFEDDLLKAEDVFGKEKDYRKPPINLLSVQAQNAEFGSAGEIELNSKLLIKTLDSFGVSATISDVYRGPSVTRYELVPAEGVKISKITGLADDIALRLAASGVRIEAPIPNKSAIGIEVPNKAKATVFLREIIDTDVYRKGRDKSLLNVALGKDITGNVICADLAKMPHLLIAGTTGSGKSVCINSMIMSILFNASPDEVKLLMIDPKKVEFTVYTGIPHLLVPVVSDARKAAGALNWAVTEMLRRYKVFSEKNVRDITGYKKLAAKNPELEDMNRIVIFIDELSDLMMVAQSEVEDAICRLAQMARAAGMHLVIATQRPSVDVITGLIKANIPSRIALSVSSQIDSRTIIDMAGAEKLLGYGDMLFNPVGISKPLRVQGCFVSDEEVEGVVDFIKSQQEEDVIYDEDIMDEIERQAAIKKKGGVNIPGDPDGEKKPADDKLPKAIEVVVEAQMASTTLLQRKLGLGYARAAKLIDELEERKIVGPFEGSKPRKVLMTKQQWMEMCALSPDGVPDEPTESSGESVGEVDG